MKHYFLALVFIIGTNVFSQQITKCIPAQIEFETPLKLTPYNTGTKDIYGFENTNNYAVDIEVVPLEQESEKFRNNIKDGAYEFAKDMGFKNIKAGSTIRGFRKSFYVLAYENQDDNKIPVYIIALIDAKNEKAYEITIYCYNLNEKQGKAIAESIQPIQTNKS